MTRQKRKSSPAMIPPVPCVFFLLFVAGCGGAAQEPSQAPAPESGAPETGADSASTEEEGTQTGESDARPQTFDIEAMMAREFPPLPTANISDPDGKWQARVEAKGPPTISLNEEGVGVIQIPVGTGATVDCFVYKDDKDVGGSIGGMFELTGKTVTYHRITPTYVGAAGSYAMIGMAGLYTIPQNGGQAAGLFKLAMLAHPTRSVLCYHDELGYGQSFERVAKGLFETFHLIEEEKKPEYAEVWTTHMSGIPIGFTQVSIHVEKDGKRQYTDLSAMVLPRTPTELNTTDSYTVTKSDKKGQILKKHTVKLVGSEVQENLELERTKKGKYSYKGTFHGKPLEGTFSATKKLGLPDDVSVTTRILKAMKKGVDDSFPVPAYLPSLAPDKLTDTKCEVFGTKTPKIFLNHMGELTITGTADENDEITKLTVPMGTLELTLERVYSHGNILEI